MLSNLFLLLLLFAGASLIYFLVKRNKKKVLISLGIGLISFVLFGIFTPETTRLTLEEVEVETNADGLATIKGRTNATAQLQINGETISLAKDGQFSYDTQLSDVEDQIVEVRSDFNEQHTTKEVTVLASSAFKKKVALAAKKEEEAQLAKLAAEKLARQVEEVETALRLAESDLTEEHYDAALALLSELESPADELTTRLSALKDTLTQRAQLIALTTKAEDALAFAEESPSDTSYDTAKLAIEALPDTQQGELSPRLGKVKDTLTERERASQVAAAAAAATTQDEADTSVSEPVGETVLVTPTGKKYHRRACGNGTYTPATLEVAQSRGLTACAKCF